MTAPQRLDAVCELTMGQAPDGESYNSDGDGLPLIAGAGDFGDVHPAAKKFTTAPGKVCCSGDIVLGIRATIGEKVIANREYCLGRGVAGLRARASLDSRYLWHWLTHVTPILVAKAKGATFKQVNREDIGELAICLPPPHEQRRIAEVLDRAEALRAKRRAALAQLDTLNQSIFLDMFGDPATNPKGWPVRPLQEVVREGTIVTYGIVQAGEEFPGGVPYIRTGDIVGGETGIDGLRHTAPEIAARFARSRVETGDIVMSIRATVGTTALVPVELNGANLTQGTARIAPGRSTDRHYLLRYLRSAGTQHWISRQIKGATFREITLARLRELPVALPPLSLQRDFARRVVAVEKLRASHRASLAELDALFGSLQHRAFRGEL
jgi:type I restriction enzyme S subunit